MGSALSEPRESCAPQESDDGSGERSAPAIQVDETWEIPDEPEEIEAARAAEPAPRKVSENNIHTRVTAPPPPADAPAPSVVARGLRSRKKTLEFAPPNLDPPPAQPATDELAPRVDAPQEEQQAEKAEERAAESERAEAERGESERAGAEHAEAEHAEATPVASVVSSIPAPTPVGTSLVAPVVPRAPATGFSAPAAPAVPNFRISTATPPAHPAVVFEREKGLPPLPGPPPDPPDVIATAIEPHLAWQADDARAALFKHLMRGEYREVLQILRAARARHPRVVNIAKAMAIVEEAECARLLHDLGATSSEVVVTTTTAADEGSPRGMLLRLARTTPTLGELLAASSLPRMRTLMILHDLTADGSLALRQPPKNKAIMGFGKRALAERRPADSSVWRPTSSDKTSAAPPIRLVGAAVPSLDDADAEWSDAQSRVTRTPDEEAPTSASVAPSAIREELAPELARLDLLDAIVRTSLRPVRIDPEAEAPDAAGEPGVVAPLARRPASKLEWLTLPAALAALIVSTVTLVVFVMRPPAAPEGEKAQTEVVVPAPLPPPAPAPVVPSTSPVAAAIDAKPESVSLQIEVSPRYARFYLDGMLVAHPARLSLARDGSSHELRCEAGGYKPHVRRFEATQDAMFVINLEPVPRREAVPDYE